MWIKMVNKIVIAINNLFANFLLFT